VIYSRLADQLFIFDILSLVLPLAVACIQHLHKHFPYLIEILWIHNMGIDIKPLPHSTNSSPKQIDAGSPFLYVLHAISIPCFNIEIKNKYGYYYSSNWIDIDRMKLTRGPFFLSFFKTHELRLKRTCLMP
ncbi:hypothetical protein ACJX0J_028035, partial [Zea mays]